MKKIIDKVYGFDYDGNILSPDTLILLEQFHQDWFWELIEVPIPVYDHNPEYNKKIYRFPSDNAEKAFLHARDFHTNSKHRWPEWFQIDSLDAIKYKKYGPSFFRFMYDVLLEWRLFCINTARWQVPDNIKHTIKKIIDIFFSQEQKDYMLDNLRTKYGCSDTDSAVLWSYLDNNCYFPVSNIEVTKLLGIQEHISSSIKKTLAMDRYIRYLDNYIRQYQIIDIDNRVKLWFSDDGYTNIKDMLTYFVDKKLSNHAPYNHFNFRLYYTGKEIDTVEKHISQQLVDTLGKDSDFIVEKKRSPLITGWDDYDNIKIML